MKTLTQEEIDSYRFNGFLFPLPALTAGEVATSLAGLERLERDWAHPSPMPT